MKVIFMGTPAFSVPIVDAISKVHDVVLVCTQPDTYNYKKKTVIYSPVKTWALEHNIEVFQPEKIRLDYQKIIDTDCDIIVTAAYGQIIGKEVLDHPNGKVKAINVHGSLLPMLRGGAPIQRSIINGNKYTGITIQTMALKMDAGDILYQEKLEITDFDNQDTIFDKLSKLSGQIINNVLEDISNNTYTLTSQDETNVTYAYNLTKEDEHITFDKEARDVFNQIRGLNSNPGGYFIIDDVNVKVYDSVVSSKSHNKDVGLVVGINKDSFDVSCLNNTVISIKEIQLPSKKKMKVSDFLNGMGRKMIELNKEIK